MKISKWFTFLIFLAVNESSIAALIYVVNDAGYINGFDTESKVTSSVASLGSVDNVFHIDGMAYNPKDNSLIIAERGHSDNLFRYNLDSGSFEQMAFDLPWDHSGLAVHNNILYTVGPKGSQVALFGFDLVTGGQVFQGESSLPLSESLSFNPSTRKLISSDLQGVFEINFNGTIADYLFTSSDWSWSQDIDIYEDGIVSSDMGNIFSTDINTGKREFWFWSGFNSRIEGIAVAYSPQELPEPETLFLAGLGLLLIYRKRSKSGF